MEETVLASCSGVAKIFKVNTSQTPRDHTCVISLVRVGSNIFLQQEGNGIKKIRQKVKGENIHKLETRRLSEGILTIILMNSLWETIVIIKADVNALRRLIRCLESLKSRAVTRSSFGTRSDESVDDRIRIQQQLEEMEIRAQESDRRAEEARQQLRECEQHLQERTREVTSAREQLRESERRLTATTSHWIVRSEEVEMTGPELGRGGWAIVSVATFRGVRVAAKTIHRQIISHHNVQLFRREMNMAARLRHPNLVQFIGATMEGNMVILTELMPNSLRAQLQRDVYMPPKIVMSVSLDVARALNYLHRMQPDPIIHRDISSANVLLEPLLVGQWRAKLSDYGTVNLFHQLETVNPGSPVYAAPEANDPRLQSTKMDIYSFGALMLEMLTGQLPTPEDRPALLLKVHHDQLLDLIHRCLSERAHDRPDAATVIGELTN